MPELSFGGVMYVAGGDGAASNLAAPLKPATLPKAPWALPKDETDTKPSW